VSDILSEGVLDNFQNLFFSCKWNVCVKQGPEKIAEVLIEEISVSDGVFDVQDGFDCIFVEDVLGHFAYQLRNSLEVTTPAGFHLVGGGLPQEEDEDVEKLIQSRVLLVLLLEAKKIEERKSQFKVDSWIAFEDVVVRCSQPGPLINFSLPILEDIGFGTFDALNGVDVLVVLIDAFRANERREEADRGGFAVVFVKEDVLCVAGVWDLGRVEAEDDRFVFVYVELQL
jgi:hypothetical protein